MQSIIGVDVGGTRLRAARFDLDYTLLERAEQPTEAARGADVVLNRLVETIRQVLPESPDDLTGIGLALPGPLDQEAGTLIDPPNLPMKNVPIAHLVQQAVGGTVYIGNDADLAGLGEYTMGAGQAASTMVYITISTGIGGGIIHKGGLIVNGRGQGGEVGHMVIDPNGPMCGCGHRGHLEALASGPAIARDARQRLAAGEDSLLREMSGGDPEQINTVMIGKAARQGDPLARDLIRQAGRYIGMGIASLMVLLNPDMFVLGGGVTHLGSLLFDPINEAAHEYAMSPLFWEHTPIVPAQLGDDVGLYGAAVLVKQMIAAKD